MFSPKFHITSKILNYLTRITESRSAILVSPMVPKWEVKLRKEAMLKSTYASTNIEGNTLSLEEVSELMIGRDIVASHRDKTEVINYFDALEYLDKLAKVPEIQIKDMLKIQEIIMHGVISKTDGCGRFRQGKEYVYVGNALTGEVVFRPPITSQVPALMQSLVDWINSNNTVEINAVLEAGIVHYEMVRIHPFIDGNGRTARALATLVLLRRQFDIKRFFALDDFYNSNRRRYYEILDSVNPKTLDLTNWLEYFCEGVLISIEAVRRRIPQQGIRLKKHHKTIMDYVMQYGHIDAGVYAKLTRRKRATRIKDLHELVDMGLLRMKGKSRGAFYILNGNG